jgi:putative membrane-bound dehydrogenase-like protein
MRRLASLLAFVALASPLSAQPKGGPLSPQDALKALKVADGFQVELFAAEPMLINPTSIDVDHRGRVWVAEAVNYRRKNFGRPIIRPEGDRIQVLVDEKGEGKASKAVTFYQGPEIYGPLGVCVAPYADGKGQRVFVCQSPDILVFEDKDGDLKADGPPKKFLTGFGGFDHDHGVHGLNIGPDGKLYFTVGDAGVNGLQSTDGKGRKWTSNTTDCRAGTVWRCDMDGTNLELIAHNFRNNYECCVNSFGEVWLSDNDDDGNKQTRICFVMPGGNYGYHPRGAGQTHWHEEQPGIVHKTLRTGQGSPTGITFYEGSMFPKKYQGALLHCDCAPAEVRWFIPKAKGAGYELEKEMLLTSSDNWFRPSDVCVAPDGSIFVADWYDRGVGGHGMGDPTDGRIYRITPKGHKGYTVPEVKLDTKEGVVAALTSPCQATRALAISKLNSLKPGEAGETLIAACLQKENLILRVRAAWAMADADARDDLNKPDDKLGQQVQAAGESLGADLNPLVRCFVLRQFHDLDVRGRLPTGLALQLFEVYAKVGNAATFRETLVASRHIPADKLIPLFYSLAKKYDGQDIFYRAALNIACGTDPARRDAILADFDKHFPEWNDKVADLVWELRPKSVLPRLGKLLADAKLTAAQKARIVDILATSDDPAAGQTMLALLLSDAAPEVKAQALDQLRLFLPTKWKELQKSEGLATVIDKLLKNEKTTATGLQLVAAAGATDHVDAVAKVATSEAASRALRVEAVRALGKLRTLKSVEALNTVVNQDTFTTRPVTGLEALTALAALVPGPAKDEVGPKALAVLQAAVGRKDYPPVQKAAVEALAGTRPGSVWLLDAHGKNELPKELLADAGRLLRNSPYADLANRAKLAFPAPGKLNPKSLPAVGELAKRTGDATRGKAVWNASAAGATQCAKCHTVRGVGGQVGPDLSSIGKKASRENLYESILIPSKAIADQYIQHSVTTTAEVTVSGLLVSDTPAAITLRDANGKDTVVPKKDIDGPVRKLKTSIMPEDIVAGLTEEELVDLVAYLETLKVASLTPDSFHVVGPFPAESMEKALDTKFGPEDPEIKKLGLGKPDPNFFYRTKDDKMIGWKTIRPDGKGYFDLAALHGTAGVNSASYMYVEIESPTEQAGEILLGPDDGAILWLNGKEVHTSRESKAAAPEAHKIAVKLQKGKNAVLLKVANGSNPHGFYFSLTSAEETKVSPK